MTSARTAPAVVVVPGGPGTNCDYLRPGLDPLAKTFRLVYTEQNAPNAAGQIAELAQILKDVAHDEGMPIRLLAHSWGTHLALEVLARNPGAVSHAALVAPMPLTWTRTMQAFGRLHGRIDPEDLAAAELLSQKHTDEAALEVLHLTFPAYVAPRARGRIHCRFTRCNVGLNKQVMASIAGFDQTQLARALAGPTTTVIIGDHDFGQPDDVAEFGPHVRRTVIENCGHFPFDEDPDAFAVAAREALGSDPSRRSRRKCFG